MAGGFNNSIVGGIGKLIREWIQSPNFVHNVSGWSINRDGSAEFQNIIARGDLSGSTLTVPEGAVNGTPRVVIDSAGHIYVYGVGVDPTAILGNGGAAVQFIDFGDPFAGGIIAEAGINGNNFYIQGMTGAAVINLAPNTPLKVGNNGKPGKYYAGLCNTNAQVIANSVTTVLTTFFLVEEDSDYGAAFSTNAGTWTCPVDGWYDVSALVQYNAFVAGTRTTLIALHNGTEYMRQSINSADASGAANIAYTAFITAGTVLSWDVFQASGAAQTLNNNRSHISVARRL